MGKTLILRDLLGQIKDKASLSKAALIPTTSTHRISVIRATTHVPPSPPTPLLVSSLLTLGDGSRATASSLITALIDRLHKTHNSIVALKCLIIIHNIVKHGSFILQDQLSVFPTTGGYNYLNKSSFRDVYGTLPISALVRWYARYLETVLSTSRVLGFFIGSSSFGVREDKESRVASFLNKDLVKEVDSLVELVHEICEIPDSLALEGNMLVKEIKGLVLNDQLCVVNEVLLRLSELKERLSCLSFGECVELTCHLRRLQDCKDRFLGSFTIRKPSVDMMWSLVEELKDEIGMLKVCDEGAKLLSYGKISESARFEPAGLRKGDSVRFQSSRFVVTKCI